MPLSILENTVKYLSTREATLESLAQLLNYERRKYQQTHILTLFTYLYQLLFSRANNFNRSGILTSIELLTHKHNWFGYTLQFVGKKAAFSKHVVLLYLLLFLYFFCTLTCIAVIHFVLNMVNCILTYFWKYIHFVNWLILDKIHNY